MIYDINQIISNIIKDFMNLFHASIYHNYMILINYFYFKIIELNISFNFIQYIF